MSVRFELPSSGCQGLDMPDGTKYQARPGKGYVEVERDDHVRALSARSGLRPWHQVSFSAAPEVYCGGCGFRQFAAMSDSPCPHCGGDAWAS